MSDIIGTEIIFQQIGRWDPADVAYVRRVAFANWDGKSYDLVLTLLLQRRSTHWPDPSLPFWEAEIAFQDVRDLVLTICGPSDIQTVGFLLCDIRDRQWDGQNLLVGDYEELTAEGIRFGARSAEVRSCQLAKIAPNSPTIWRTYPGEFRS